MNDFINLSAVENSPEISTALSSSKTVDNSQSTKDKAVVVHVFFSQNKNIEDLQEFQLLAESANVEILQIITTSRATPQAKYFIGEGKAQEIADAVKALDADVVLVNHQLTPAQTRNLESICQCRVVDRTGVILDIFAQRARSHEGKLQVELAQLKHLSTRLGESRKTTQSKSPNPTKSGYSDYFLSGLYQCGEIDTIQFHHASQCLCGGSAFCHPRSHIKTFTNSRCWYGYSRRYRWFRSPTPP